MTKSKTARVFVYAIAISAATAGDAIAQSPATAYDFHQSYHIGFDSPEAWGLKYFASASLLSGLQPPEMQGESRRTGAVTIGLEAGWIPSLDAGQQRIGFGGTTPEDLNKAPAFVRPVVRVTLPWKLTALVAAPPPLTAFGLTPHLLAFGLERPIYETQHWMVGWRGYGQIGSAKGAFTCPKEVLAFAPGSTQNPTECVGLSADVATLRYAGMEFQLARHLDRLPKLVPHVAVGGNFIAGVFQVHAPIVEGLDETRLWTHGGTASFTGGASYLVTKQIALTVDVFYSPLGVQRSRLVNDGLLNVRALVSYRIR